MKMIKKILNYFRNHNNHAFGMGGSIRKIKTNLSVKHIRNGKMLTTRNIKNRVVTDAFVNNIVDNLDGDVTTIADYKYHDSGTGVTEEDQTDTALVTPCGEDRDTGTQAGTDNAYESVATHTYEGTFAITEHGLFNAASGVTLMDRTVFAAINVVSGDKIEFTFTISFTAGG